MVVNVSTNNVSIDLTPEEYATLQWALKVDPIAIQKIFGVFLNQRALQQVDQEKEELHAAYKNADKSVKAAVDDTLGRKQP